MVDVHEGRLVVEATAGGGVDGISHAEWGLWKQRGSVLGMRIMVSMRDMRIHD